MPAGTYFWPAKAPYSARLGAQPLVNMTLAVSRDVLHLLTTLLLVLVWETKPHLLLLFAVVLKESIQDMMKIWDGGPELLLHVAKQRNIKC